MIYHRFIMKKPKITANEKKRILENHKWFSKFSPVEKLKIAKRASKFSEILKNAK